MPQMWQANSWGLELILVYAGFGKGKTCACVGQALRAAGNGLRVLFGQFLKRENLAGEQKMLAAFSSIQYKACGLGFIRSQEGMPAHRAKAKELLAWVAMQEMDMLILDEALNAMEHKLINQEDLSPYLTAAGNYNFHLVLSGRIAPDWLIPMADTFTEMLPYKHQFEKGVSAIKGLEF